ncbi:MAG: lytic transglycosylase domain-containing protein, partial [Candidatus Sumerlaeia bacterium]|nr:lytic transglycosylase domain-containing protein [Candidatus Sumerlaeia bacterium]
MKTKLTHSAIFCALVAGMTMAPSLALPCAICEGNTISLLPWEHPTDNELDKVFDDAAAEFGVPSDLLRAVAWVESRWIHTGPSIDQGWGIMHLVENDTAETLTLAAKAIGESTETLKQNPVANIRGAAAILAQFAKETAGDNPRLEDYQEALLKYSGLHPDAAPF